MKNLIIRSAIASDGAAIEAIENRCFHASRRSSRRAIRRSLRSKAQRVWVAVDENVEPPLVVGAMILHAHSRALRIFSLAVLPSYRGSGLGRRLVEQALAEARRTGRQAVTLEADRRNRILTDWYAAFGFTPIRQLPDYYAPGRHAVRMRLSLQGASGGRS